MMAMEPELKICSQCFLEKLLDDFHADNKAPDNKRANCKLCENAAKRKAYEETREDPESVGRRILKKCKERAKERQAKKEKRQNNLEYLPDVELTDEIFNLTLDWVFEQRDIQQNKCFYCNQIMSWSTGYIDFNKRMNPFAVTIERLNSFGNYVQDNCSLTCWRCNCFKGDGTLDEMHSFAIAISNKYMSDNFLVSYATRIILDGDIKSLFVRSK